ncbi:MAG: DsbA family oxidoreductase [Actinobacteria bacterium]|nr:DsbA family oxidoreductase [Actinomycetota bacterium]
MRVQIWSDIVCPWCYIGKRHFEAALAQFPHADEVELVWRSFELDPGAKPSGAIAGDYANRLASKYGTSTAEAQQMLDQMTERAADEGLDFRFELSKPGNTFDAHRLLHLALENGRQDDLKEAFDDATFTKGLSVSDHSELLKVAVGIGLDEAEVTGVLTTDRYAEAVRQDEAQAQTYGITGVPFFVIDDKYGISGAQPAETILRALTKAWDKRSPLETIRSADGEACNVDDPKSGVC